MSDIHSVPYSQFVAELESPIEIAQKQLQNPQLFRMLHAAMGLSGESGEIIDALKKVIFYGKPLDEKVRLNLIEELGDNKWYFQLFCNILGIKPEEVEIKNKDKLQERYDGIFSTEKALNRNLEAEQRALEGNKA